MICSYCQNEFDEDSNLSQCNRCSSKGCNLVKCPKCGYKMPRTSSLIKMFKKIKEKFYDKNV